MSDIGASAADMLQFTGLGDRGLREARVHAASRIGQPFNELVAFSTDAENMLG